MKHTFFLSAWLSSGVWPTTWTPRHQEKVEEPSREAVTECEEPDTGGASDCCGLGLSSWSFFSFLVLFFMVFCSFFVSSLSFFFCLLSLLFVVLHFKREWFSSEPPIHTYVTKTPVPAGGILWSVFLSNKGAFFLVGFVSSFFEYFLIFFVGCSFWVIFPTYLWSYYLGPFVGIIW